jgi:toxin YoeB
MEIEFTLKAKDDVDFWRKSGNKAVLKKIRMLLDSVQDTPFKGIGKPGTTKIRMDWILIKAY